MGPAFHKCEILAAPGRSCVLWRRGVQSRMLQAWGAGPERKPWVGSQLALLGSATVLPCDPGKHHPCLHGPLACEMERPEQGAPRLFPGIL